MLDSFLESNWTALLVGGVVFLLIIYITKKWISLQNYPPGPRGVPLYGNTLQLKKWDAKGPYLLDKWAKEFGEIYSITLGMYPAIVLNSIDVIKEVLLKQSEKTSGRATNVFFFKYILGVGNKGIIFNDGQSWKDTRRTVLHSLRDFGMGKKSLEHKIQDEARALVDYLDTLADQPLDPRLALHNAFSNIIVSIVFGERYEYNDAEFNQLANNLNVLFGGGGFKNPELFSPLLIPLMPIMNPNFFTALKANKELQTTIKNKIKEHREHFDSNDVHSFIDIFLKAEQDGEFQEDINSEQNLFFTITDLFFAGSETTTTTTRWAILYLVNHPHVQDQCRKIIMKEIGQEHIPTGSDREKMPYIQATMNEIQRMANIVPYSVLRRAEDTMEVFGYTIPKDTLILTNLHCLHKDPKHWDDPELFNPERWLGPDGKLINHEAFMPFGIGPRECLGKSLAVLEIFIVLVSLLQKFIFKAVDPENPPKIAGEVGIVYKPFDYQIQLERW